MDKTRFSEEKMRKDIVQWVTEARVHWRTRFDEVDDFTRRYEAKRSISGLVGWGANPKSSPKDSPWNNASDVGIPIEAFTIEGLVPRFLKVCYGAKPNVWVRGESDDDHEQAPVVQEALNHQLTKYIKIYRRMKNCFRNVSMAGDGFVKCVWEKEEKIINRTAFYLADAMTGQVELNEDGSPVEVERDAEIPKPENAGGRMYTKVKKIVSEPKKTYDGPKIYSRSVKDIIVPKDADTPDMQELDWVADLYERTLDWCKRRVAEDEMELEEGKFDEKAVRELSELVVTKSTGHNKENPSFVKLLITEWHGQYDVNDDGFLEEIVVFLGGMSNQVVVNTKDEQMDTKLLGWMITPYPKRPFFHYQIIPKDGSFYGLGVPEFLIGIRNLIDAVFNQMIDRGSIANNPVTITPPGHDPDENPYGPGAQWVSDNPNAFRVLDMPKAEQLEFVKLEFLLSLVQKLFGVTDYALGSESSIASNRTASGIMTIVGEGNIKFDDMIRSLQDVNDELYDFIVQLNAELLDDEFVYMVTGSQENPFRKIKKQVWAGNFDFESAGNSININRQIEQERGTFAYRTFMDSYGKNPVITADVLWQATENLLRATDLRNIKLPSIEEVKQEQIKQMAEAIKLSQQQQVPGGQGGNPQAAGQ